MFESPLDLTELRSVLTDAGHTAAGFATLAAKKSTELRADFNDRYAKRASDARTRAVDAANRYDAVVTKVEARLEPGGGEALLERVASLVAARP